MSLQGPVLVVADQPPGTLARVLTEAGAFPVVEASWPGAATALTEIKPAAVIASTPEAPDLDAAMILGNHAATSELFTPVLVRVPENAAPAIPSALTVPDGAPPARLLARLTSALRVRTLHATVLTRAQTLRHERNIIADLPSGDPLDDATVLLIGRGRNHPTLSVAVGERMGVVGALSVETAARCLNARELDGIVIGDGLSASTIDTFLTALADDSRFREMPVAVLGSSDEPQRLPNFVCARDPALLLARAIPFVRMRAFETALKRLLTSIECKGMLDGRTGLFTSDAFGDALGRAIADAETRGARLSLARFSFDDPVDRRTSLDAARLISRLVRNVDFACRQDDGSILFAFGDTDLRDAHVAARRLASVLKHTMLRSDREHPAINPSVTLATLKPSDTMLTLLSRVAPRPVAAA